MIHRVFRPFSPPFLSRVRRREFQRASSKEKSRPSLAHVSFPLPHRFPEFLEVRLLDFSSFFGFLQGLLFPSPALELPLFLFFLMISRPVLWSNCSSSWNRDFLRLPLFLVRGSHHTSLRAVFGFLVSFSNFFPSRRFFPPSLPSFSPVDDPGSPFRSKRC